MTASFFTNPGMLAALAAVALPILIEWLFRRRKRQVELPTLRFLLRNKEQEKVKRQDRILLILRTVALFLLVFSLARPLLQRGWMGGARQRHVVLLLDGTASMNQRVGVTTAFGLAQKKAAALARGLPPGTAVTAALLGERAEVLVESTEDRHTAAALLEGLRAGSGAAPAGDALAWVKDHLDRARPDRPELYLFSDFQKHTWRRGGPAGEEARRLLHELCGRCETYLVDVGGAPRFNYIAAALKPAEAVVSAGMPVRFLASIAATGTPPPDATATVSFLVDGVKKDTREARPAGTAVPLTFEHRFQRPGEYVVETVVEGDDHPADNRRLYLCSVPEDVRVLVIDENADAAARESLYLSQAIAPSTPPGTDKLSPFSVKVVPPGRVVYENLESYAVVVLAGTGSLSEPMAAKLDRYVGEGGAAWFFMGPSVNLYEYNKLFFKNGTGMLPCRLVAPVSESPSVPRFADSNHPALQGFIDLGGVKGSAFTRYISLQPDALTRTVLSLSDGAPALVEKAYGRGRVLLTASSAGTDWTYLPATAEFPVLVQELLRYLVGDPDAAVNLDVGGRFEQPVFVSAQHLLVRCPDGRKERLTPRPVEGREGAWRVSFDKTSRQGLYEIDAPAEVVPRRRFAANASPEEGDLSRLLEEDFRDALGSAGRVWVGPERSVEELAAKLHTVTELAPGLLWLLAAILAAESFLAARFGLRRSGGAAP